MLGRGAHTPQGLLTREIGEEGFEDMNTGLSLVVSVLDCEVQHSLIITREGLILPLSICSILQGWI